MKLPVAAAAVIVVGVYAGCSDPCGPGSAATNGLRLATSDKTLDVAYWEMTASENNDCPDPTAPAGVVSLTIAGKQEGLASPITFCVARPDRLANSGLQLDTDVTVVDVSAVLNGCTYTKNRQVVATGSVSTSGLCDGGKNKAGFALSITGTVSLIKKCPAVADVVVSATLDGTIAIVVQ
jgi:hypothetical protein